MKVDGAASASERPPALFAGVEPLEVFVELLADIDTDTSSTEFYDRICEAICRLTSMRRAAIFMADAGRRRVRAVGAHGTSFAQLQAMRPTLVNTPIAQRALLEDSVVVVSERIEDWVPAEFLTLGITSLVCTPLSAAGRSYGVICADRGGEPFELSDGERHLLWTLGKTAALVATARNATRQQERTRRLGERLDLAREIHEQVMQRLFGVSLALSREELLDADSQERCAAEVQTALTDLRTAITRPLGHSSRPTAVTFAEELARVRALYPTLEIALERGAPQDVPANLEALAQSILVEAVRNASKHAHASRVGVSLRNDGATLELEVRNDGADVHSGGRGGVGLRLATLEALQHDGVLEYGECEPGAWQVRLVVPTGQ